MYHELIERLLLAMPATTTEFYAQVRLLSPTLWSYLHQCCEPRSAAIGALQFCVREPHFGFSPAEFVHRFEAMKEQKS